LQSEEIERDIYNFIVEAFLSGQADGLGSDDTLLSTGVIDSTGVTEMVVFLQEHFEIILSGYEIIPENFDSIRDMAALVTNKLAASRC
jgi:acyl carrier protein